MKKCLTIILFTFCLGCSNNELQKEGNKQDRKIGEVVNCDDYHIELTRYTPVEFLKKLKVTNNVENSKGVSKNNCPELIMCNQVSKTWISKTDLPILISYLDSNTIKALPVFSSTASITPDNHGKSTLANEAYHLIQGYRKGVYPFYSSIPLGGNENNLFTLSDSLKSEVLNWWQTIKNK
jgi:hypothetical protein